MKHLKAKETYNINPYIHKHVDLWVEDDEIVSPINKGTEGQVITKGPNGEDMWGNPAGGGVTPITYAELKALRNEGKLVAGQQYRITDYHCTTAQENTQSADHQFDIIVTADSESVLNENARAIQHVIPSEPQLYLGIIVLGSDTPILVPTTRYSEGDIEYDGTLYYAFTGTYAGETQVAFCKNLTPEEHDVFYMWDEEDEYMFPSDNDSFYFHYEVPTDYFADSNLAAWELKYSIDNDKQRFAWATNGGIESMSSSLSNGTPLKRCPDFDGYDYAEELGYHYAWGTDADIEDTDPANFIYSKIEYPNPGDMVLDWGGGDYPIIVPPYGKGVIYYMKDEWNNECPYDFKNIQFKRKLTDGVYDPDDGDDTWVYTFNAYNVDEDTHLDATLLNHTPIDDAGCSCKGNVIKEYNMEHDVGSEYSSIRLNDNVFLNTYSISDESYFGRTGNTFMGSCTGNTFGDNCRRKHLEYTSNVSSGISGTTPEFWFDGEKKW